MNNQSLNLKEIESILPQRYPFLLIDQVLDYKENDYLLAIKNVTGSEWSSNKSSGAVIGFPENLIIEAAAQAAILFYHLCKVKEKPRPQYFLGKVETTFFYPVQIGDQLKIKVLKGKMLHTGGYSDIEVETDKEKISNIRIFFSLRTSS